MPGVKIATCHFCGTKAALVLRGNDRHELSCASCGAPLHDMKMLPKQSEPAREPAKRHTAFAADSHSKAMSRADHRKRKKPKKSKSFARRALGEIWDVIEDIID
ncbi:hypothetical protein [Flavimaricola marinus]|uniref:TFIIB zinc-binding protein n=1 Tax=Flavimaricola marinus TaxID=1819565 RepID=A0A238LID8_9RHOB|nr:hypothetical protein [Flavimaricola marinus]SMY09165.1 hypothetical protein LOM8899_03327 [Flavimaricola marinus]